jgi:hypothetical protein
METSDEVSVPVSVLQTVARILRDERPSSLDRAALDALAGRLEALLPKQPESLHEVIFWEVRSGPSRDEREWADWIIRLCRERIDQACTGQGSDAQALRAVYALFEIPEGRDTETVVSEVEAAMAATLSQNPSRPEMTIDSCPAHDGHRWCRRTRWHVGYHVDTQGNSFGGLTP